MKELICNLTKVYGPAGNEEKISNYIKSQINDYVDEIYYDKLGNLIAVKKGNGKKIMLATHMDEIGVIITYIDDNGYLRFSNLGGINRYTAIGQRVIFENGIIGVVSYESKLENISKLQLNKMYIDIGSGSKEEAMALVGIGDAGVFMGEPIIQGSRIIAKALDDRIGCAVLFEIIKNKPETENEIYYVFTIQEELGAIGATTSAYGIMPDLAIAVDVTATGDTPECRPMAVQVGKGPAIKVKDRTLIAHPVVKNLLVESAKVLDMDFQFEILEYGGTDAGRMQFAGAGVPSGVVSIPCRYIHSPSEMVDLNDAKNAVKLIIKAIQNA